jgi:hypothetical protein
MAAEYFCAFNLNFKRVSFQLNIPIAYVNSVALNLHEAGMDRLSAQRRWLEIAKGIKGDDHV